MGFYSFCIVNTADVALQAILSLDYSKYVRSEPMVPTKHIDPLELVVRYQEHTQVGKYVDLDSKSETDMQTPLMLAIYGTAGSYDTKRAPG